MYYERLRSSIKDNKKKAHFLESLCVSFFATMHIFNYKQNKESHQEKGADFIHVLINGIMNTVEVKNLKTWYLDEAQHLWRPAFINYDWLVDEVLARYLESDPYHLEQWTLFISFWNTNDPRVTQLVEDHDIQVIVTGVQVLDDTTSMSALSNIRKALYINYNKKSVECCCRDKLSSSESGQMCSLERKLSGEVDYALVYSSSLVE